MASLALVWDLIIIEQSYPTNLAIHLLHSTINKVPIIKLQQVQKKVKLVLQPV
jgi:hypothetical protein